MSDYGSYLSPKKARQLPINSRERSIASHSLRQAWHYIFDYCPTLLALYPSNGKAFLDNFLDEIEHNDIGLNWKIFFLILNQHKGKGTLTKELCSELVKAAAIRWTIADFTKSQSIFIVEKTYGISILGLKADSIDGDKIFQTFIHDNIDGSDDIYFSVSTSRLPQDHENWEAI